VRISTRQLADAVYRALRVAAVPSGVAVDAARDAVELERKYSRGLDLLVQILQIGPPLLVARCQVDANGADLHARGASALLLAAPLVALACDATPSTVTIRQLAHAGALEPALIRSARAQGLRVTLTATDGASVLRLDPQRSVTGPLWSATSAVPLDVRLAVDRTQAPAPVAMAASASDRLVVDREIWDRLDELAARYLV
jgi:hypothetical protein